MTEGGETTALEKQQPIECQRETEPSETQTDIPEDRYEKCITGQVSADAVCLENVLDSLNGKTGETKGCNGVSPNYTYLIALNGNNLSTPPKLTGQETGVFIYCHSRKCCHIFR